jgi:hypothetical protein
MSVDKFKFISPGIFVNEIDNTGRTAIPEDVGPVLIGRAEKGPILQPTRVDSYFDFVNMFGAPVPGGKGGDVVRDGNYTSPTYAAYAAQAWFRNNSPITYVRLGGQAKTDGTGLGLAGWKTTNLIPSASTAENGGAYGLFVADTPTRSTIKVVVADAAGVGDTILFKFGGDVETTITCHGGASTADNFTNGANKEDTAAGIVASLALNSAYEGTATIDADDDTTVILVPGPVATLLSASFKANSTGADYKLTNDGVDVTNNIHTFISYSSTTGTLAATWYIDQSASIGLSGTVSATGDSGIGTSIYFDSVGTKQFKVQIKDTDGVVVDSSFNFSETSDQYIRKVFNTNPILTNSDAVSITSNSFTRYWLGESYEGSVNETLNGTGDAGHIGVILPLINNDDSVDGGDFTSDSTRTGWQDAKTGYFFAQDTSTGANATGSNFVVTDQQKLFRLVARNSGDWVARNLKVSIKDIRKSPNDTVNSYGSFSVVVRRLDDTDNRVKVVEQFNNCNLNPNSQAFVLRKIGDRHYEWDESDRRYRTLGDYPNLSKYIWVDMPDAVRKGDTDAAFLPWGVQGPLRFVSFTDTTASAQKDTLVSGNLDNYGEDGDVTTFISGATGGSLLYKFPELRLRISGTEGDPVDPLNSFYGVDTTFNTSRLDSSVRDYLKIKPVGVSDFSTQDLTEVSFNFTLDDMCRSGVVANKVFAHKVGARAGTGSAPAARGGLTYLRGTGSYTEILDAGCDRFTTVFHGGFDGLDITESEPLRIVNDTSLSPFNTTTNYMFNSMQVAIDSVRDPEIVEYNLASMPGVKNTTLNQTLIDMCEDRGDALAIVDLEGGYTSQYESTADESTRRPANGVQDTVNEITTNLVTNSSYGAAYYPWVQIRDTNNGQVVWVPPSVVAIGAMSYSQKASNLWFAPAGFTRGGLSAGNAGLPVVGVRDRLTSRDRDKLYENKINPIAQFPAEGIVIFGQKTLQSSASALDRINVRRLMIFLKRQISRYASTILFDQNVRVTWNRFKGQVEPFLRGVQAGLGITEFKLVLDETTTTPDLVDRNIVYAKIYIKPARAIEYIAIDFILTDSGAAFED